MVTNLFKELCFLLLLLLLYFTVCEHARASSVASLSSGNNSVVIFEKEKKIENALYPDGKTGASLDKVDAYYSPSLVSTDDMMIAVVGVNRTADSDKNVDILTKYIEIKEGWDEQTIAVFATNINNKTQFAFQQKEESKTYNHNARDLLAVAKENKIYLLLMNYKTPKSPSTTSDLELKLVVGTVKNKEKKIEWEENKTAVKVPEEFKKKLKRKPQSSNFLGGSAFLTKEGTIVFALVVDNAGEIMTAFIYSNNPEKELKFVYKENGDSCFPYYFPWAGKIIMLYVDCFGDDNKTMELSAIGQQWNESKTLLFQQHDFFLEKFDFVTATIEGEDILLFVQHNKRINTRAGRGEFLLWFSDGTRVSCVGTVDADFKDRHGESFFTQTTRCFCCFQSVKVVLKERLVKFYLCA